MFRLLEMIVNNLDKGKQKAFYNIDQQVGINNGSKYRKVKKAENMKK